MQISRHGPLVAARRDRFIISHHSPRLIIGGGVIVDTRPRRHRRFEVAALARLATLERGTPAERVLQALAAAPQEVKGLAEAASLPAGELKETLAELLDSGDLVVVDPAPAPAPRPGDIVTSHTGWQAIAAALTGQLAAYHRQFPLRPGAPREEMRSRLGYGARLFDRVVALAALEGRVVEEGALLRLPEHAITFSPEQQRQADRLLSALGEQPAAPPSLADLAADPELVAALVHAGRIVKVAEQAAFLAPAYQAMVEWTLATIDDQGSVTVAGLRDRFATSRKHALALLEHLDAQRITRRQGDARVRW